MFLVYFTDIVINGEARIPNNLPSGHNSGEHMYFSRVAIMHLGMTLLIEPQKIHFNGDTFDRNMANGRSSQDIRLSLTAEDDLIVHINSALKLKFISHRHLLEILRVSSTLDSRCSVLQSKNINYIFL